MAAPLPDEQVALLAAIVADPDDDTPRLVYADWLQENGDAEQAEFIRGSVAAARSGGEEPERRGRGKGWLEALALDYADLPRFERGLPDHVVYWSPDTFRKEAAALFARLPIRDLAIIWQHGSPLDEDTLPEIGGMPELRRLHTLRLANYGDQVSLRGWVEFLRSPHLGGLRMLSAGACGLTDDHALALAHCQNLTGLTALDLSDNDIGPAGALAVVMSRFLRNVTRLSLADNDFDVNAENPDPYAELHTVVAARFGGIGPLHESFDE